MTHGHLNHTRISTTLTDVIRRSGPFTGAAIAAAHFVVLQRQRLREGALLLPGKRAFQIVAAAQRPM
jgi:hypothetical protein